MDKKELTTINQDFLQGVSEVLAKARKNAKTAVNLSMVYAYFEIGRMIVEEEQREPRGIWEADFERVICVFDKDLRERLFRY